MKTQWKDRLNWEEEEEAVVGSGCLARQNWKNLGRTQPNWSRNKGMQLDSQDMRMKWPCQRRRSTQRTLQKCVHPLNFAKSIRRSIMRGVSSLQLFVSRFVWIFPLFTRIKFACSSRFPPSLPRSLDSLVHAELSLQKQKQSRSKDRDRRRTEWGDILAFLGQGAKKMGRDTKAVDRSMMTRSIQTVYASDSNYHSQLVIFIYSPRLLP